MIAGGAGGTRGGNGVDPGANGAGGAGITGSNLSISNSGTISGGLSGDSITRADAITFTGGTANSLTLGGTLTGAVGVTGTLTLVTVGGATFANVIHNAGGAGAVTYNSLSTLILSGANTYTGATTVAAGTLLVDGSITSATMVQSGGTLGGHGTVGVVTVQSGGTFAPGNSAAIINTGNFVLQSGATLEIEIGGTTVGTQYDQTNVTGTVTLGGMLDVSFLSAFDPSVGQTFTIISNDGSDAVIGTFAGLAEGGRVIFGGEHFRVSYIAGDGNDVTLTSIPNAAPVVAASIGTTAVLEQIAVAVDAAITLTDDGATLASATVSITSGFALGQDVLGFTNSNSAAFGNITSSYDATTGVLTLSSTGATATTAQFQAALRAITYTDTSDTPATAARTISFVANDGSESSLFTAKSLSVTPVNDAPTLTGDHTATVLEGGSYVLTSADLGYADSDDSASDVTFTASALLRGAVLVNGTAATTFTGVELAAGLVSFLHDGSENATASFDVSVEDGNEDASAPVAQLFALTVTPVNEAPTLGVAQVQATLAENISTSHAIKVADITIGDVDGGTNGLSLTGADSGRFVIVGNELFLKAGAHLDFETNPVLDVTVSVDDASVGTTPDASVNLSIDILNKPEIIKINGNGKNNVLTGGSSTQIISGKGGDDTIKGGGGNDTIIGGHGADVMTGGAGHDVFVFKPGDFPAPRFADQLFLSLFGPHDTITDFRPPTDKIDLHAIDANTHRHGNQAFHFEGENDLSRSRGELVYRFDGDAQHQKTILMGDTNGDGLFDIRVVLNGHHTLHASDFIL